MLQAGDVRPILTIGDARHPDYPDVPTALELVSDPAKESTLRPLMNIQSLHRTFFGPPGIPQEVADEMRTAIMAVLTDPKLIETAKGQDLPLNPMDGAQQQKIVAEIYEARRYSTDSGQGGPVDPVASRRPSAPEPAGGFLMTPRHPGWATQATYIRL